MAGKQRYGYFESWAPSDAELQSFHDDYRLFTELQTYRNIHAGQWEETSMLIDPTSRNTFFFGSYNFPGQKMTQQQVDSTGMLALQQFCAIVDSLITPKNLKWHGFRSNDYVMKDRASRLWFDQLQKIMFDYRYRPAANFHGQNFSNWKSLGAYGNSVMYIEALDTRWHRHGAGLRYKSIPLGECFFGESHQGIVDICIRWFRKTARQAAQIWGEDGLPEKLKVALESDSEAPFQFIHVVRPRDMESYDPQRLDARGKPFVSRYHCVDCQYQMGPESGYRVFPYAISRYDQMPGEVYGRGPAQMVLPTLKTLNNMKKVHLKAGHRSADPVLLTADDGLVDGVNLIPGALNKGGVNADGKPMVHTLPVGSLQISEEMMREERSIIDTMFLTSLFKTLTDHPDMTATQVIELMNERGMLVAPTLGRQHNEYVGSLVPREIDVLLHLTDVRGKPIIPPMPPRLREAMGEYEITDTSPLAMAARSNEAAGLYRTVEFLRGVATDTGDPSVFDRIDFDSAVPEVAQINGVPERWTCDDNKLSAKRKQRAQQAQQKQAIDAMPAQAAMMKAQAVQAKAGIPLPGQQQQQPGGMPQQ